MKTSGYTKLFANIVTSSIWAEPLHVRVMWTTLLALCGSDGVAKVSENSVWRLANITEAEAEDALRILSSPDPFSKSQAEEGRRIVRVEGGFLLVNFLRYRDERGADWRDARRDYMRLYMRERRAARMSDVPEKNARKRVNLTVSISRRGVNTSKKSETAAAWRDHRRVEAERACSTPVPQDMPGCVQEAVKAFQDYRFSLAVNGLTKQDCKRWRVENVQSLLTQIRLALGTGTPPEVVAGKLHQAVSGGWKSVNFNSLFFGAK